MVKQSRFSFEYLSLFLIIAVGALLRFYHYADFSLSNDELSAITRTHFNSLKDLIHFGVKLDDMHPAGTQVFLYYWTKFFGETEAVIRFPFIISGILAILFSYLVASKWVNKTAGLFVAASIAFLQFPILYSQIARPYIFGLLFTLVAIWFWTRLLFDNNKKKYINVLGYSLSTSLVTYTHHYAFLFAIIVGVTGLLYISKETVKYYFLSVGIILLLYIPHIHIFLYQFGIGGVGGWLGKPDKYWFWRYVHYCFNNSFLVLFSVLAVFGTTSFFKYRNGLGKFQKISILWFLLSFFIGYFYSIYRNPILQYSILLFSFPFLLIFLFSFIDEQRALFNKTAFCVYSLICLFSTTIEKDYYGQQHFTEFKKLASRAIQWDSQYGTKNITKTINITDPYYINYYLNKFHHPLSFLQYKCVEPEELVNFRRLVDSSTTKYFMYGWSSVFNSSKIENSIRRKYNVVAGRDIFLNSGITLYQMGEPHPTLHIDHNFEGTKPKWMNDSSGLSQEVKRSGNYSFKFEKNLEYGPSYTLQLSEIESIKNKTLQASVWIYAADTITNAALVINIEQEGSAPQWQAEDLKCFIKGKKNWTRLFINCPLTEIQAKKGKIDIYVWNLEKKVFYIDDFEIKIVDN
jgi:hypothetical protein